CACLFFCLFYLLFSSDLVPPPLSPLFPYTTLFRSPVGAALGPPLTGALLEHLWWGSVFLINVPVAVIALTGGLWLFPGSRERTRSEEHTSELQSRFDLVCRLLLEKKKKND